MVAPRTLPKHSSRQHLRGRQTVEEINAFESDTPRTPRLSPLRATMAWAIDEIVAGFAAYGEPIYGYPLREDAGSENSNESWRSQLCA